MSNIITDFSKFLNEKKMGEYGPEKWSDEHYKVEAIFHAIKADKSLADADVSKFENGREQGWNVRIDDRVVSFANNRNSDDTVVYFGTESDFDDETHCLTEEAYDSKDHKKYFPYHTPIKKIKDYSLLKDMAVAGQ